MEAIYFGQDSHRLFGVLDGPLRRARTGLVFCPSYGEEFVATYARFALWGKELTRSGNAVFRYHSYGTGESDGISSEFSVDSAVGDAVASVSYLRKCVNLQRVGLFGLRFGGFLAVQAALKTRADFLLLWSPTINLRQYCRELLRLRLTTELVHQQAAHVRVTTQSMIAELESGRPVDILGHELAPDFYRQMNANPPWPAHSPVRQVLWLTRSRERIQAAPIVETWKEHGNGVDLQSFDEPAFWEDYSSEFPQKFAAASVAWLEQSVPQLASVL